ncbi:MAG: hypothetical protein IIW59_03510, partial [Alistipes sp.]|nr:hypothetical protein [Alistipes sp.]
MEMIILALVGGLVIGGVAAWLVLKGRNERVSALLESEQLQRQQLLRERQEAQAAQVAEREKAQATERDLYAELARLQSERAAFEQQIASLKESAEQERTVVGLIITYVYNLWVARTLFKDYPEEQFLMMYGMLTGTA